MKIPIKEVVLCEGRYDKIKLDSILDADIMTLDGFGIFKSNEKKALIRECAKRRGIIIVTDSDSAGMVIRNYIKNITGNIGVSHIYAPRIEGKESRKAEPSKEGVLGIEGLDSDVLREMFEKFTSPRAKETFERVILYEDGFIGADNSAKKRELLAEKLSLPKDMSTSALIQALSIVTDLETYRRLCGEINNEMGEYPKC